jgi:hypothetical protein
MYVSCGTVLKLKKGQEDSAVSRYMDGGKNILESTYFCTVIRVHNFDTNYRIQVYPFFSM